MHIELNFTTIVYASVLPVFHALSVLRIFDVDSVSVTSDLNGRLRFLYMNI